MPFDAKFQAELRQHYAELRQRNEETRKALAPWRPAEASQGKVNDFGPDEGFFSDMEAFRKAHMGTGFEQSEANKHRTLGSVGLSAEAFSDGNSRDEQFRLGNNDPNRPDIHGGGGASVFDDLRHPGNPDNFANEASRRGLPSVNDEQQSETNRWLEQGGGGSVTDSDGVPPGGGPKGVPWIKTYPAAGRGLVRGARFYGK